MENLLYGELGTVGLLPMGINKYADKNFNVPKLSVIFHCTFNINKWEHTYSKA